MLLSPINGNMASAVGNAAIPVSDIRLKAPSPVRADSAVAPGAQANQRPEQGDVEKALQTLNDFTSMVAQDVRFSMDEESGKTIIKVVDTQTMEVLRQFPSAEALSIARSIDKMQGLLIREKA